MSDLKVNRYEEIYDDNPSQMCLCNRRPIYLGVEQKEDGSYVDYDDYEKLEKLSNEQAERIAGLESQVPTWVSVEEFTRNHPASRCWIIYKGSLTYANYIHGNFEYSNSQNRCFMTECISAVMPIDMPQPPTGLSDDKSRD